eukprot:1157804-Pelagomonas_calceolata.AAC.3
MQASCALRMQANARVTTEEMNAGGGTDADISTRRPGGGGRADTAALYNAEAHHDKQAVLMVPLQLAESGDGGEVALCKIGVADVSTKGAGACSIEALRKKPSCGGHRRCILRACQFGTGERGIVGVARDSVSNLWAPVFGTGKKYNSLLWSLPAPAPVPGFIPSLALCRPELSCTSPAFLTDTYYW